ncbi:t18348probable pol truncated-rice blast fungus magnaporthe gypsy retrotransposon [Lasallia pustulata]|uniref:T18348probable pol truncated-rice blast fungus magnaporthe gypsy retrotransposon n=1 Tax=Lasallia pustulata TaxID=136370 RepID=A0A1W5CUK5_9LECA|nr:t18348probable pol truncated-rice blast fungus magnaporthe gypsy retrotransposon [Lasallia pustulata]
MAQQILVQTRRSIQRPTRLAPIAEITEDTLHEADLAQIWLQEAKKENARLKAELIPLRGELEAKDERIAQLDELLMLAEQQVQQSCEAIPLSSVSITTKRSAKFPDPPVFTGEITDGKDMSPKFEPWVLHVHDKLQMNQDHFEMDAAKTAYVLTYLSGDAMDHICSYRAGDPNYFKTSDSVFRELRQDTKTPFLQFFSEFIRLAQYLQFPEIVLIEDVKEKVLPCMQKLLSESSEDFNTLTKLKDRLIHLNNQQRNYFASRQKANTETEATKKTPISKTGSQFKPKVNTTLVQEVNTTKSTEVPGSTYIPRSNKPAAETTCWKYSNTAFRGLGKRVASEIDNSDGELVISSTGFETDPYGRPPLLAECCLSSGKGKYTELALVDTGSTVYTVVDEQLATEICERLNIEPVRLLKPRPVCGFNGQLSRKPITHAIYPTLMVNGHIEKTAPMLLTKLGLHQIILGRCDQLRCSSSNKLPALNSAKFVDKAVITEPPKYSILKRQKAPSEKKSLSVPGSTTPLLPDKTFNDTVDVAIIGAAAFNQLNMRRQYQDGVQLFSMTIQEMERALSEQTADNTSEINISVLSMEEVLAKIKIEGDRTKLPRSWVYPISNYKLQKLKEYLDENLKKGFISPSHAPDASPVLFVVKANGSLRVCVDYQKLNAITKRNQYPIPLIEETLAKVTGCKYLIKLDVIAAFNKLRMHPNSEDYTTFITSMGAYKYHVLPFGLTNGPANYQHYMNDVLWDHLNNFCSAYLDDILIYSKALKEHTQHVWAVLQKLIDAGLQVDIEKCKFHVQETSFLGVLLSTDGLRMDLKKVQVVVDWSTPTNLKQVQAFIGFCNFYRRFIKGFSKIVGPMLKLTQKGVIFQWTDTCQKSFELLKQRVVTAPVLWHFDQTRKAILETDSSDHVNAGVLSQYDDNKVLHPVAFYSKNMVPAECNYEIYDKELLAIIRCLEY